MEAPKNIYLTKNLLGELHDGWDAQPSEVFTNIEYTRTDAFIEKVINFLNYKLDDVVAIRVSGTIIPHHVAKQDLIEDFKKYMKGE